MYNFFRSLTSLRSLSNKGFTLIEMIIAVSIFVGLTTTLLFNYNGFNKRLSLDTLAHQIAQWARDAQVSAMSVRRASTDAGKFPGYGLHFERATPTEFIFFADLDGDKRYTPPGAGVNCGDPLTECEKIIKILQGNKIEKLCGESSAVVAVSADCGSFDNADDFDIVFTRPNPDAEIRGEYAPSSPTSYARAEISVVSPLEHRRTIEVWTTGQISVQ